MTFYFFGQKPMTLKLKNLTIVLIIIFLCLILRPYLNEDRDVRHMAGKAG